MLGPIVKGIGLAEVVVGPVAPTLCVPPVPAGPVGTLKLADHDPVARAVIEEPAISVPSQVNLIFCSFAAKPVPFAVTDVPGTPVGFPQCKVWQYRESLSCHCGR